MKNGTAAASSPQLLIKYKPTKNPNMNSTEVIQISSLEEGGQSVESEVTQ